MRRNNSPTRSPKSAPEASWPSPRSDSANRDSPLLERGKPAAIFLTAGRLKYDSLSSCPRARHAARAEAGPKNWPRIGQACFASVFWRRWPDVELIDFTALKVGASGRTRTCNLLIRSQKLYPIELRTHGISLTRAPRFGNTLLHHTTDRSGFIQRSLARLLHRRARCRAPRQRIRVASELKVAQNIRLAVAGSPQCPPSSRQNLQPVATRFFVAAREVSDGNCSQRRNSGSPPRSPPAPVPRSWSRTW